jgi:hypothetical protein
MTGNEKNRPADSQGGINRADREIDDAVTRTLIAFLEADNPGTRWFELADGEEPPADAVAIRRFGPVENPEGQPVTRDDDS